MGGPFEFVRGGRLEKEGDKKWKLMPRNSGLCVSKLGRRAMGPPTVSRMVERRTRTDGSERALGEKENLGEREDEQLESQGLLM